MKVDKEKLNDSIMEIIRSVGVISDYDLQWIYFTLNRKDDLVTVDCFRPLLESCDRYHKLLKNPDFREWDKYCLQKLIEGQLNACKAIYYKQKTVLIGVPQRRKYKELLAPNFMGFISPQSCRIVIDACYGLGYCESRQYFVDKALADDKFTHVMFVDDDVLLPLNTVDKLLAHNEMFIGASYVKKNVLLESTATHTIKDPKFIWTNASVPCDQNNLKPVPVNAMGLGATLIDLDFFRGLPKPHFSFQFDKNGKVLVGEDSLLCQRALISTPTIQPMIVPGLVGVHVDFATGKHYAPEWLVDPVTRKIRPEFEEHYTRMACDPKELYARDVDNVFNR